MSKKKKVKDKGEGVACRARVEIRKNTSSLKCFHSGSVNRYENVFGVLPSAVKTLSMETWNQNAFSLAVAAQTPLSVIIFSLSPHPPTLFRCSVFPYYTIFMQRWKSQIFFLQHLCCYCWVSCTYPGVAQSDSAVLQNVFGIKLLLKHQMR